MQVKTTSYRGFQKVITISKGGLLENKLKGAMHFGEGRFVKGGAKKKLIDQEFSLNLLMKV